MEAKEMAQEMKAKKCEKCGKDLCPDCSICHECEEKKFKEHMTKKTKVTLTGEAVKDFSPLSYMLQKKANQEPRVTYYKEDQDIDRVKINNILDNYLIQFPEMREALYILTDDKAAGCIAKCSQFLMMETGEKVTRKLMELFPEEQLKELFKKTKVGEFGEMVTFNFATNPKLLPILEGCDKVLEGTIARGATIAIRFDEEDDKDVWGVRVVAPAGHVVLHLSVLKDKINPMAQLAWSMKKSAEEDAEDEGGE